MKTPQVGVVIPILNRCADTLECLTSLTHATYPNLQVYVVDNGSTDDSTSAIASQFPAVIVTSLRENHGFARASNVGIRQAIEADAQFVLLLNNDTVIAPNMISLMVNGATLSDRIGILTPRVMYYGENRIWSMGSRMRPLTLAMLDFDRPREPGFPLDRMIQVDTALGCGMFVTRRVFDRIGLLDEAFFFYYEDLDFSLRAREAGFEIWTIPWAQMWHKVSASTEHSNYLRYFHLARGSVRFYYKHTAGLQRGLMVPYRLGSAIRFTWQRALCKDSESIKGYLHGLWEGVLDVHKWRPSGESL